MFLFLSPFLPFRRCSRIILSWKGPLLFPSPSPLFLYGGSEGRRGRLRTVNDDTSRPILDPMTHSSTRIIFSSGFSAKVDLCTFLFFPLPCRIACSGGPFKIVCFLFRPLPNRAGAPLVRCGLSSPPPPLAYLREEKTERNFLPLSSLPTQHNHRFNMRNDTFPPFFLLFLSPFRSWLQAIKALLSPIHTRTLEAPPLPSLSSRKWLCPPPSLFPTYFGFFLACHSFPLAAPHLVGTEGGREERARRMKFHKSTNETSSKQQQPFR